MSMDVPQYYKLPHSAPPNDAELIDTRADEYLKNITRLANTVPGSPSRRTQVRQWIQYPQYPAFSDLLGDDLTQPTSPKRETSTMLQDILKMYKMGMQQREYGVIPHIVGPPGCGKSTVVAQAAELLGVTMHTYNVSRMNPLSLSGLQMPNMEDKKLELLHATYWTNLKEGDIILLDEFLRGFPEVYNALLDVFTSREVEGFELPNVFVIAASNSVSTYDPALEDRLIHLPVSDPRKNGAELMRLKKMFAAAGGLLPEVHRLPEMDELFRTTILPTFDVLDSFTQKRAASAGNREGRSIRRLLGELRLRTLQTRALHSLIKENNRLAFDGGKMQFYVYIPGDPPGTTLSSLKEDLEKLESFKGITPAQELNRQLNLQLLEADLELLALTNTEMEEVEDEDIFSDL